MFNIGTIKQITMFVLLAVVIIGGTIATGRVIIADDEMEFVTVNTVKSSGSNLGHSNSIPLQPKGFADNFTEPPTGCAKLRKI